VKLSVLVPVYDRESPIFLGHCLESLARQTRPGDEVVMVEDGELGEPLKRVIDQFRSSLPVSTLRLRRNVGLGAALRAGLSMCRGELVARMDSDDIAVPERFERQLSFLATHPQVAVVGGAIAEFRTSPQAIESVRRLPACGPALRKFAKFRNPLNHMTAMFRRQAVLEAGSYQPCAGFEDYHLWVRMLRHGCELHNLPDLLVYVRCGNGMQQRRGGFSYFLREVKFQRFLHSTGMVAFPACARNVLLRAPIRIAPAFVRSLLYGRFLRDPAPPGGEFNVE
jgi:glycosyltransferase involved in cell wall biosynthesis